MLIFLLWLSAILLSVSALLSVMAVGKRREPLTGGMAVAIVIIDFSFAFVSLWAAFELAG